MTRTDIPDPTPLDEAIWALHVSGAAPKEYRRAIAGAALTLFPRRGRRAKYAAHRDETLARREAYRATHPDKRCTRSYANQPVIGSAAYRDEINAKARLKRAAHRDEERAYAAHRDETLAVDRDVLRARSRARRRARYRARYAARREEIKAKREATNAQDQ